MGLLESRHFPLHQMCRHPSESGRPCVEGKRSSSNDRFKEGMKWGLLIGGEIGQFGFVDTGTSAIGADDGK